MWLDLCLPFITCLLFVTFFCFLVPCLLLSSGLFEFFLVFNFNLTIGYLDIFLCIIIPYGGMFKSCLEGLAWSFQHLVHLGVGICWLSVSLNIGPIFLALCMSSYFGLCPLGLVKVLWRTLTCLSVWLLRRQSTRLGSNLVFSPMVVLMSA